MSPYPNAVCHHCMDLITRFGGIWFVRRAGAVCYRSPDTQHRPLGRLLDVPPPKLARDPVKRAQARAARETPVNITGTAPAPLPASVIARGADTDSAYGTHTVPRASGSAA